MNWASTDRYMPAEPINVFVLGDLVLDHVIPVRRRPPIEIHPADYTTELPKPRDEHELPVRYGLARRNFAGGAAISARLAAAFCNDGRTCLWGLSGRSQWGSFHDILELSQHFDAVATPIMNYASHNEARRLNTSIVIMLLPESSTQTIAGHREYQILDFTTHKVTEAESRSAFDHLKTEQESTIHVVIFADLNLNALSPDLVRVIGNYLYREGVPIVVDTRAPWSRYQNIRVRCAVLSLNQWRDIVKESDRDDWLPTTRDPDARKLEKLREIGILSHRHMPLVSNLVIHCFEAHRNKYQGTIVVAIKGEATDTESQRPQQPTVAEWNDLISLQAEKIKAEEISVYLLQLAQPEPPIDQIGTMRILSAAVGIGFGKLGFGEDHPPHVIANLVQDAGEILRHYLDPQTSAWHRVPTPDIHRRGEFPDNNRALPTPAVVTGGELLLPPGDQTINLRVYSLLGSRLTSDDRHYTDEVARIIDFFVGDDGWLREGSVDFRKTGIITGQGGMGKSELIKVIKAEARNRNILVWDEFPCEMCHDANAVKRTLEAKWNEEGESADGLLVVLDEAFKEEVGGRFLRGPAGVIFLQRLRELPRPTRACLVDKNFYEFLYSGLIEETQFKNRCEIFDLPPITKRMRDLAYIFARSCFDAAFGVPGEVDVSNKILKFEEDTLVRAVNWVLGVGLNAQARSETQIVSRGRELVDHATTIGVRLRGSGGTVSNQITVRAADLPRQLRMAPGSSTSSVRSFDFIWTNS